MAEPDPYSNAWWRTQIRGILHSVNRCNCDYADTAEQITALTIHVAKLEAALFDAQAEIGRLRSDMEEHVNKIREAYKKLKNGDSA